MLSMGVREFYAGKTIFITGATGFMGKVLVYKLLRSCPDLKTIYILVRKKKGQSPEARLETFINCRIFEKIQTDNPKALNKLRLVSGDILEESLGLSKMDEEELLSECQILFNNAACVRFDLNLREAVKFNTMGTQKLLKLAENMKKLEVFVHVSTSFCHDELDVVEDKLYPSKHNPDDIINLTKWMDDKTLALVQAELIKPYPNTYGYTKCLTEELVSKYEGKFPIVLARPSIVVPALNEPMPGWVDNLNGATGIIYAASRGVLHTMYCKESTKMDTVPVDITINALILLAYLTGLQKPKDIRVCNITQYLELNLSWVEAARYWQKYLNDYPLSFALWYPVATAKNYKWEHKIHEFLEHTLPAYFIDLILFLLGKKTFMIQVIKRLSNGLEVLEYYNTRTWVFKNDFLKSLPNQITKEENEIFSTNILAMEVEQYMKNYLKGIREFCCNEDDSSLPRARILHKRLYYLHVVTKLAFYALCVYFLYWIVKKIALIL
ncbi:putative fatty acyl-CoA reductase CG5065 [Maniola jurtina]|uniref:putative fatty acyl-CoA reductase CG5065 n=1 Tax=Maniola jurtina TaxID=191418 RepID=UPI001E68FADA|nr:putative fatty acyl-CoA reductase CG5065 [Maniola jurtina]